MEPIRMILTLVPLFRHCPVNSAAGFFEPESFLSYRAAECDEFSIRVFSLEEQGFTNAAVQR
jgi:hypothetical protein